MTIEYFSDGQSLPSPTIADLMFKDSSLLLAQTTPAAFEHDRRRVAGCWGDGDARGPKPLNQISRPCIHCGEVFSQAEIKGGHGGRYRVCCSDVCYRHHMVLVREPKADALAMYEEIYDLAKADGMAWRFDDV